MKNITSIIAIVACFIGISIFAQEAPKVSGKPKVAPVKIQQLPKMMQKESKMPFKVRRAINFFKLADELQLTDEQIIQLRGYYKKYFANPPQKPIKPPMPTPEEIMNMTEEQMAKFSADAGKKLQEKIMFGFQRIIELRKILTPEQLKKIKTISEEEKAKKENLKKAIKPIMFSKTCCCMPKCACGEKIRPTNKHHKFPRQPMMPHNPNPMMCPQQPMMPPMHNMCPQQPMMHKMPHNPNPMMCPQQPMMPPMHNMFHQQPMMHKMPHNPNPMMCPQQPMMPPMPNMFHQQPMMHKMPHNPNPMMCPQQPMMPPMYNMCPQHNNMRQIGKCHKPQCNKNNKPMCQNSKFGCLNKAAICDKNFGKKEPPSPSTFKKIFGCQKEQKCDKLMKDGKVEPFPKKEEPCKLKEEK